MQPLTEVEGCKTKPQTELVRVSHLTKQEFPLLTR